MPIRVFDTLTRTFKDLREPSASAPLKMYVCGPTVYDDPHIGHARSAYVFDVIRRYVEYRYGKGTVRFIRNVTDVDDKIINKANETGASPDAVATRYLQSYHKALDRLGILPPDEEPKATAHIPQMQKMIKGLIARGSAYAASNGDVYFAVRMFKGYGKLSNRSVDELEAGARVEPGEDKRDPLDFALWKAAKSGEPSWADQCPDRAPVLAAGRPGWHIECSAMSMQYLGESFDVHGGGVDLVFPHHENEVAQSQAFTGDPSSFAQAWIHNGLLTINGQKMSKSLGNFLTIDQVLERCGGEADALKLFFLNAHYRHPVDYSDANISAAIGRLRGFLSYLNYIDQAREFYVGLAILSSYSKGDAISPELVELRKKFIEAMDDDFNTPRALAVLHELCLLGEQWAKGSFSGTSWQWHERGERIVSVADTLLELGGLLGLFEHYKPHLSEREEKLIRQREECRKQRKFAEADAIRKQFENVGIALMDTPEGTVVRPLIRAKS